MGDERALVKLRELVLDRLPAGAAPQELAVAESASNGSVENAVKLAKGLLRVHLSALEAKIDGHITSDHPIMAWMAEFVGDAVTKGLVAADGKTSYERLYGKECRDEGLEYGEKLMWRSPHVQGVVLDARWQPGIWLGRKWGSPVHIVFANGKVHEVRSIQRKPASERWDRTAVEAVSLYPWSKPEQPEQPVSISFEKAVLKDPVPEGGIVHRTHITLEDLNKYGYQSNCPRCRAMQAGKLGKDRKGLKHSESCRERIEKALRNDNDPRIVAADERINAEIERRHLAQQQAEAEERQRAGAQEPSEEEEERKRQEERRRDEEDEKITENILRSSTSSSTTSSSPSLPSPAATPSSPGRLPQSSLHEGHDGEHDEQDLRDVERQGDGMDLDALLDLKGERVELEDGGPEEILGGLLVDLPDVVRRDATRLCEELVVAGLTPYQAARKITELYSVPRVTAELERLPRMSLAPGSTFDLREDREGRSFDFSNLKDRQHVRQKLSKEEPWLVIGSPPCVDFSPIQELNRKHWSAEEQERRRLRGRVHLLFCLEVYQDQLDRGAHFLHEHPSSASSWREKEVQQFREDPRVHEVVADQCTLDLR